MKPFYTQQALHFECTGCGKCCTGDEDHYIALSSKEAKRIQEYLGVGERWFKRYYITHLTRNTLTLRLHNGQCAMLDKNGKCRIYPLRPTQCKTYPWWPEILDNKTAWEREARHCEGIHRGNVVAEDVIEKKVSQQLRSEMDTE